MRIFALALTAALSCAVWAEDKIYTWTDETGQTVFGDRPPQNAQAKEVRVNGQNVKPVEVDPEVLPGQWLLIDSQGQITNWSIREPNRIEIESVRGSDREVISGTYSIEAGILNVTTTLIQSLKDGQMTRNDAPVLLVYKFTEFGDEKFKVYNNGGILSARKN